MPNNTPVWKSKELSYEGFPLLLRYPEESSEHFKIQFPELAVITHGFSNVRPDGLPEPDYNDGLLQFDRDVRATFEMKGIGHAVLIETFGGKRKYYIYIASNIDIAEALSSVQRDNPNEKLSWLIRHDPEWDFIKKYQQEFLL